MRGKYKRLTNDEVRTMLEYVTDYERNNWASVGMALKHGGYPFEIWREWSLRDPNHKRRWKERNEESQWKSFKRTGGNVVTLGSVIRQAQQNGWKHGTAYPADMAPLTYVERHEEAESASAKDPDIDITEQIRTAHDALMDHPEALQHFRDRGLTDETINRFMLGYLPGGLGNAFPGIENYTKNPYAWLYKYSFPNLEKVGCLYGIFENESRDERILAKAKKYYFPYNLKKQLYNVAVFQRDQIPPAVFVTEGVYDALSVEQCGFPAVALGGVASSPLITALESYNVPYTVRFIIALDNDTPGNSGAEKLCNELMRKGYLSSRYTVQGIREDGSQMKDANELLMKDPDALRQQLKKAETMALSLENKTKLLDINFTDKDLLAVIESLDPLRNKNYKQDELSAGSLFADTFRPVLRFNESTKTWFCYNGIVWKNNEGNAIAERCAMRFTRMFQQYAVSNQTDEEIDTRYLQFAVKLGDRMKRSKMVEDGKALLTVSETDFDKNTDLLNCQNCIINLQTGEVLKHDPELLLSKCCNVVYDPDADSSAWEKFISEIMLDDAQKIEYLGRILAYGMLGTNEQEKCFLLFGKTSRNGKSTLISTVTHLLGSYARSMAPETLATRQRDANRPDEQIARLRSARFVSLSEPSRYMKFDASLLKNLTGGDSMTASFKYGHTFEYIPVFKIFINTNHLPAIDDDTLFSSDRIQVLTFDRHFEPAEQNRWLKRTLKKPEVLSGVLNWLLAGLERYKVSGVDPVQAVITATEEYRNDSDQIRKFFEEYCRKDPGHIVPGSVMYENYKQWCSDCGYSCDNKKTFYKDLRDRGLLYDSGTFQNQTVHNVVKNYALIR